MATGAYKRILNLLESDRKRAVSEAGFNLGKESIAEARELEANEAAVEKEIRRIERENRKRGNKKGFGGLLGGALGFALAGPLGIGTGLASGLGALAGTRAAGRRNQIEGIDPSLTLRENADFFAGRRQKLEDVVDDIDAQLDDQQSDELFGDVLTSIGIGATGGRFGKTDLGQKIAGRAGDLFSSITGRGSLDLGEKISQLSRRAGMKLDTLFGRFPDSSQTGLKNILGIDDTPVEQRLQNLFRVQSPQDATGQTLLDMDSYGPSVLSGGNTTSTRLDMINRANETTLNDRIFNAIKNESLPDSSSLITSVLPTTMDDMASQFSRFMPGGTRIPGLTSETELTNAFPAEQLRGFLPRSGRESIESVRQRIVDGIPADYEGGVEQFARDYYQAFGDPPLTPEELRFLTTGEGAPVDFEAINQSLSNRFDMPALRSLFGPRVQMAMAPTQSQLDSLQNVINPGLNAPFFANFPSEFNERGIRELFNAPEGNIDPLLQFYGIVR